MKPLLLALAALAGLSAFAPPASAYVIFEVTACDTVSVAPARYRTTFAASTFAGPGFSDFVVFGVPPVPTSTDTTRILACGAPTGWSCESYPGQNAVAFGSISPSWGGSGERTEGFWIESDRSAPCVLMIFWNPVENVGAIQSCLRCDMPIPAQRASWGSVKSRYR